MLKFNKIENFYGIRKIVNPNIILGNTIVYAPNGVMKTSFSEGIELVKNGHIPKDVFNNIDSVFEIEDNGNIVSESDDSHKINAIVYYGEALKSDVFQNPDVAKLVTSVRLKTDYDEQYKKIQSVENEIFNIIKSELLTSKSKDEIIISFLSGIFPNQSKFELLLSFSDTAKGETLSENVEGVKYNDLFNDDSERLFTSEEFINKQTQYKNILEKEIDIKVFNNGFTLTGLEKMYSEAVNSGYFNAGHKLSINEVPYDQVNAKKLIEDFVISIYETEDVKKAFLETQKIIEKNKKTQKVKDILDKNPWIMKELSDYQKFQKKFIYTKIIDFKSGLELLHDKLLDSKEEISKIISKAESEQTTWQRVLNLYNQRFINKHFDLIIDNPKDAILGLAIPSFKKVFKNDSNKIITQEIEKRFSSGEKRAIYILSLLYEIEMMKSDQVPFTIVLDDIVDSFDYKNKYAMLEYLRELSKEQDIIQLIILTHNFDFYRSCRIALQENLKSKLLAYEEQGIVTLYKANDDKFENATFFQEWKNSGQIKHIIAMIPLLRNFYQYTDGSSSAEYLILTDYLHYNSKTGTLKLDKLNSIYETCKVKTLGASLSNLYIDELFSLVKYIVSSSVKETDLLSKTIIGIGIRVMTDYYMYKKYILVYGTKVVINEKDNCTHVLFDALKSHLTQIENDLINSALTIAPPFIHVNSFMYEPLIDIGSERIIDCAKQLLSINGL